jgi:hypothetical protein
MLESEDYLTLCGLHVFLGSVEYAGKEWIWARLYRLFTQLSMPLQNFLIGVSKDENMRNWLTPLAKHENVQKSIIITDYYLAKPAFSSDMKKLYFLFKTLILDAIICIDLLKKSNQQLRKNNMFAIIIDGSPILTDQAKQFLEFKLSYR